MQSDLRDWFAATVNRESSGQSSSSLPQLQPLAVSTPLDPQSNIPQQIANNTNNQSINNQEREEPTASVNVPPSPQWQSIVNETQENILHQDHQQRSSTKNWTHIGILREQIDSIDGEVSEKLVKEGNLWQYPPEVLHSTIIDDLNDSYKLFFIPRIFHWYPDLLIPNWKPKCGSCGCSNGMVRNGKSNPPRMIYDSHDNYLLNAPCRWKCKTCERTHSNEKEFNNLQEKERTKYSWLTTDQLILDQIRSEHPDIYELFPCHLSHRSGIDKKLMDTIIFNAMKGIGPNTMADAIRENHFRTYQRKEIKWLGFLKKRRDHPLLSDRKLKLSDVKKCPGYCSDEIGGRVPSGNWLVVMFCTVIGRLREYFDAECISRLLSSKIFALDASYKVPKWIMRWGGVKLFNALVSALNEYGEIILQHFEHSDNHRQLEPALKTLQYYGLNPNFAFTDVPDRDAQFLENIFPSLKRSVIESDPGAFLNEDGLQLLPFRKGVVYVNSNDNATTALNIMFETLDDALDEQKIIGFDTENPVLPSGISQKISVIQLATDLMDDVIVIHIGRIKSPRQTINMLQTLFSRKDVAFVGCSINGDITGLKRDFKEFDSGTYFQNVIDVAVMARDRNLVQPGPNQCTLAALTKNHLRHFLPKPSHIRKGTAVSGEHDLSQDAIDYCARDAEAPLRLYNVFKDVQNCKVRFRKGEEMEVGMQVHIMPPGTKADLKPIAKGRIVKVDGHNPGRYLKLSKTFRVMVQVDRVHEKDAIVHFPFHHKYCSRCKCGKHVHTGLQDICDIRCYNDLGNAPFTVVESYSRLRLIHPKSPDYDTDNIGSSTSESEDDHIFGDSNEDNDDTVILERELPSDDIIMGELGAVTNVQESYDDNYNKSDDEDDVHSNGDESIQDDGTLELASDAIELMDGIVEEISNAGADESCELAIVDVVDEDVNTTTHNADDEVNAFDDTNMIDAATLDQIATVTELDSTISEIIAQAQDFTQQIQPTDDNNLSTVEYITRIFGDPFHLMDRVKVPINHAFKASYFQALRSAMFILDAEDLDRVKRVVENVKKQKWSHVMAFNFRYIALRVKRIIPSPKVLHVRVKAVFDFFAIKVDPTTNQPLFNDRAKKRSKLVLQAILKGHFSDPPGWNWYVAKTDSMGNPLKDKDHLPLYRSLRGTSIVESMHQNLTRSFGHTISGPEYSDCILTLMRHYHNWKASERNRPDFPQVGHCDGMSIDTVNTLYEILFGMPKYSNRYSCQSLDIKHSPYGVVALQHENDHDGGIAPINKSLQPAKNLSRTMNYLCKRQNSEVPCAPVKGKPEKVLFSTLATDMLREARTFSAMKTFSVMVKRWSRFAKGHNGINNKDEEHLVQYYKGWKKTRVRQEAIKNTRLSDLNRALQYNPGCTLVNMTDELIQPIHDTDDVDRQTSNLDQSVAPEQCIVVENSALLEADDNEVSDLIATPPTKRRKRKTCANSECPDQNLCNGGYNAKNCLAYGPHKRKSPKPHQRAAKTCAVDGCPNPINCPGKSNRTKCCKYNCK